MREYYNLSLLKNYKQIMYNTYYVDLNSVPKACKKKHNTYSILKIFKSILTYLPMP